MHKHGRVHMAAVVTGCSKALVGTRKTIFLLACTNCHSSHLVGASFLEILIEISVFGDCIAQHGVISCTYHGRVSDSWEATVCKTSEYIFLATGNIRALQIRCLSDVK